jgi:hypothetical protein
VYLSSGELQEHLRKIEATFRSNIAECSNKGQTYPGDSCHPMLSAQPTMALLKRMVDGIIMGGVLICGYACAPALIQLFGLQRSAILKPGFEHDIARACPCSAYWAELLLLSVRRRTRSCLKSGPDHGEPERMLLLPSLFDREEQTPRTGSVADSPALGRNPAGFLRSFRRST